MTEWINYHGLNRHLFVPPTQGPRSMTEPDEALLWAREAIFSPVMWIPDLDLVVRVATGVVSLACLVAAVLQWRRLDRLDREHRARMSRPLLDREVIDKYEGSGG